MQRRLRLRHQKDFQRLRQQAAQKRHPMPDSQLFSE